MPNDPLAQLRDIHLPDPVGWWPPAPGWWLLALILIACALGIGYWYKHRRATQASPRYREAALLELEGILASYKAEGDSAIYSQQVSALLKRVALLSYPAEQTAALSGDAWAEFLASQADTTQAEEIRRIIAGVHRKRIPLNATTLHHFARSWIETREGL